MSRHVYKTNKVEQFLEVLTHPYLPPATRAKTLTALAYNMTPEEIAEARKAIEDFYGQRARRLEELGAPQVMVDLTKGLMKRHNTYLDRAERRYELCQK